MEANELMTGSPVYLPIPLTPEILEKLGFTIEKVAQNLTTDASHLRKAMEEYHQFIINEL